MANSDDYPQIVLAIVQWVDSIGLPGWNDHEPQKMEITTVGILIAETKDRITIAQSKSHYSYSEQLEIPMCAVRSIKKLNASSSEV